MSDDRELHDESMHQDWRGGPSQAVEKLLEALECARDHLEYCGYGDAWEREIARDAKLSERIAVAVALGKMALDAERGKKSAL